MSMSRHFFSEVAHVMICGLRKLTHCPCFDVDHGRHTKYQWLRVAEVIVQCTQRLGVHRPVGWHCEIAG